MILCLFMGMVGSFAAGGEDSEDDFSVKKLRPTMFTDNRDRGDLQCTPSSFAVQSVGGQYWNMPLSASLQQLQLPFDPQSALPSAVPQWLESEPQSALPSAVPQWLESDPQSLQQLQLPFEPQSAPPSAVPQWLEFDPKSLQNMDDNEVQKVRKRISSRASRERKKEKLKLLYDLCHDPNNVSLKEGYDEVMEAGRLSAQEVRAEIEEIRRKAKGRKLGFEERKLIRNLNLKCSRLLRNEAGLMKLYRVFKSKGLLAESSVLSSEAVGGDDGASSRFSIEGVKRFKVKASGTGLFLQENGIFLLKIVPKYNPTIVRRLPDEGLSISKQQSLGLKQGLSTFKKKSLAKNVLDELEDAPAFKDVCTARKTFAEQALDKLRTEGVMDRIIALEAERQESNKAELLSLREKVSRARAQRTWCLRTVRELIQNNRLTVQSVDGRSIDPWLRENGSDEEYVL